jgi:hypothetical protein
MQRSDPSGPARKLKKTLARGRTCRDSNLAGSRILKKAHKFQKKDTGVIPAPPSIIRQ